MQSERSFRLRQLILAAVTVLVALAAGSCGKKVDTSVMGTFRMGERVQVGPMVYTVLEAQYRPGLTDNGTGKPPKNRYLFIKLSATNSGGNMTGIPPFTLVGPKQEQYEEVTEGVDQVSNYLGVLRMVQPAQTEQGYIIFDVPVAAYKLMISDGGEPGQEKFASVDLPVNLE